MTIAISRSASVGLVPPRCEGNVLFRRLVLVAFFIEVGLLLIVLPWSLFWEHNYFMLAAPAIKPALTNPFVRGAVSGLGIVNLCAGFAEMIGSSQCGRVTGRVSRRSRHAGPALILHLITDRRRLSGSGATPTAMRDCLLHQIRHAVDAGVDIVQLREHDLDARALFHLAGKIVGLTRGSRTRVVVNDRVDVALAAGADGVHLRGDGLHAAIVRRIAPAGFLIGRSVHAVTEAVTEAEGADYLVAGTIWPTPPKTPKDRCSDSTASRTS